MHSNQIAIRTATLSGVGAAVLQSLTRLWTAWQHRRQVLALVEADDRMLADIGLTRSDLNGALASPASDDPSYYLSRARQERLRHRARGRLGM